MSAYWRPEIRPTRRAPHPFDAADAPQPENPAMPRWLPILLIALAGVGCWIFYRAAQFCIAALLQGWRP